MSTESAAAEDAGSGPPSTSEPAAPETGAQEPAAQDGAGTEGAGTGEGAGADGSAADGADASAADGAVATEPSEAEAAQAAQRELRERIEQRKAQRTAPIESGAKLSGTAADLLAAVRAVESGERPARPVVAEQPSAPAGTAPGPAPSAPRASAQTPQTPSGVPVAASRPTSAEALQAVGEVLAAGSAPEALAPGACAALGEGAAGLLREDPWQLLRVSRVRPDQADGFARALLGAECGPDDERRGRAVTVWLLEQAALAGHTALDAASLSGALARYAVTRADEAVQSAVEEGDALLFQDALDTAEAPDAPAAATGGHASAAAPPGDGPDGEEPGEDAPAEDEQPRPARILVGLEQYALAEESLADGLARVVNSVPKADPADPSAWESAATATAGSTAELLRAVAGHALVLHTGGEAARAEPAALVAAARSLGLRVCAAVHTADGRRRFADLLAAAPGQNEGAAAEGHDEGVVTVSGLLTGAQGPVRDAEGAFAVDLLVVLDAPQLDVESAAVLVESLPDGARLVLSGDPGVLWSAGPGRVFADLLAARVCPQIASRVPDPGPIGELVSGIGIGELDQVEAPGREVVIVPVRDAGEAVHRTVQLVADSVPRAFGIESEQTQVITPGHGGAAGTRALNAALKERLNPGPGRFGGFDPGDRIAYSPAPGHTTPGRVTGAEADGLHLECDGVPVVVPQDGVEQSVRHGWALTAHQAAGLRAPAAVVVLPGDAAGALSRPWVYTAFSRGERHLSVVHGADQALPRAVAEVPAKPRTTRLPALLRAQIPSSSS